MTPMRVTKRVHRIGAARGDACGVRWLDTALDGVGKTIQSGVEPPHSTAEATDGCQKTVPGRLGRAIGFLFLCAGLFTQDARAQRAAKPVSGEATYYRIVT